VDAPALTVDCDSGLLVPGSITVDEVRDTEVLVRITHCGVCRSDLGRIAAPRSVPNAPIVPGHEIVGEIIQLGRGVSGLRVGTRVGIGWQSGSCGRCEWCLSSQEHLCADQEETCVGRSGGFASRIKVQSRFAVRVPEGLDSAHAAPLLCAGITVYSPMLRHRLHEGQRAAVVGIGGLGHLALQFLRAQGCTPDAFSTSPSKVQDARAFGADSFFCLEDRNTLSKVRSTYDFIVSTSPGLSDLTELIRMLRPRGILCVVGLPQANATFAADELIGFQKTIEGSPIGSPEAIAEMFRFAVDRNVKPRIECFPMTDGNAALQRLANDQIRYRAVLIQDLDA
jgi:uncharacterized zinc-type alcohol dehydrogenase-like protein